MKQERQLSHWEAMLKGSKLKPQAIGMMFDGEGTCAIGAMFEGMVGSISAETASVAWDLVVNLDGLYPEQICPNCKVSFKAGTLLWHLNDIHKWSREVIAYLLRDIEDGKRIKKEALILEVVA